MSRRHEYAIVALGVAVFVVCAVAFFGPPQAGLPWAVGFVVTGAGVLALLMNASERRRRVAPDGPAAEGRDPGTPMTSWAVFGSTVAAAVLLGAFVAFRLGNHELGMVGVVSSNLFNLAVNLRRLFTGLQADRHRQPRQ